MQIYQALLLLLLPLASNSQACDYCPDGTFYPDKQLNATNTCGLTFEGNQTVTEDECAGLQFVAGIGGCCSLSEKGASYADCNLCDAEGGIKNRGFTFPDSSGITTDCGATDIFLKVLAGFRDDQCKGHADGARAAGCQCSAAHVNVKIESLVVVGATFMASFFF
jgi:hypothetical protein